MKDKFSVEKYEEEFDTWFDNLTELGINVEVEPPSVPQIEALGHKFKLNKIFDNNLALVTSTDTNWTGTMLNGLKHGFGKFSFNTGGY